MGSERAIGRSWSRRRAALIGSSCLLGAFALGASPIGDAAQRLVLPPNSVGTAQLRAGAVTGVKVKDRSLTARDFAGPLPAGPPGPAGAAGPTGPAGPAGVLGLQWVGGESGYDSNSPKTATVTCPVGKRALSWDWRIELSSTQSPQTAPGLTEMVPLDSDVATGRLPGGYTAKAEEGGTYNDGWKLFVYAACVTA